MSRVYILQCGVCSSAAAATERVTTSSAAYIILCGGRQQQGTMPLAPRCGRSTRLHLCRLRSRSVTETTTAMLDGDVSRDASRIRSPHADEHEDARISSAGLAEKCMPFRDVASGSHNRFLSITRVISEGDVLCLLVLHCDYCELLMV